MSKNYTMVAAASKARLATFAAEYAKSNDATSAAKIAGFRPGCTRTAQRLTELPIIKTMLQGHDMARDARHAATRDVLATGLANTIGSSALDLIGSEGRLLSLKKLDPDVASTIEAVMTYPEGQIKRITFRDKSRPISLLSRMLGLQREHTVAKRTGAAALLVRVLQDDGRYRDYHTGEILPGDAEAGTIMTEKQAKL